MSELWDRALEAAEEARTLLGAGHPNGAVSRAYYAVFTAARVLVLIKAGVEPRSVRRHLAVLKLFSQHLVATGQIAPEHGKALRNLFRERAGADYDSPRLDLTEAERAVRAMDAFLAAAARTRESLTR